MGFIDFLFETRAPDFYRKGISIFPGDGRNVKIMRVNTSIK